MPKIKVTFADGSFEIFHEEQTFQPWKCTEKSVSHGIPVSLWRHHHDGLVPSFLELVTHAPFFFDVEHPSVIFSSSSIVKIEEL